MKRFERLINRISKKEADNALYIYLAMAYKDGGGAWVLDVKLKNNCVPVQYAERQITGLSSFADCEDKLKGIEAEHPHGGRYSFIVNDL